MRYINKIILHCSATIEGKEYDVNDIRRWHKQRGFADVGYHYIILLDGTIQEGRNINKVGAHCKGHNAHSIGICYIGGLNEQGKPTDTRTNDQKKALLNLVEKLINEYNLTINDVYCHNQLANKDCPCFSIDEFKLEYERYKNS